MFNTNRSRSFYQRGRGRGQPNYSNRGPATPPSNIPVRELTEGLHPAPFRVLHVPARVQTGAASGDDVEFKNVQYVGSYNWIEGTGTGSTIIVPGSPPQWTEKPTPYDVPADRGEVFVDQNGFRVPSATLLPLMVAVDQHAEDQGKTFDWSFIDIVTDRNGLRKLMRWIRGGTDVRDFRIDLQLAGKTVLFNRWEKQTKEQMSGYTYGFNFEKANTKHRGDCEKSTGHHRIVKYDFGGIKMVVRFEVDACLQKPSTGRQKSKLLPHASSSADDALDSITAGLANTTISSSSTTSKIVPAGDRKLIVEKGGEVIPQDSVIELGTISQRRLTSGQLDWEEKLPQLLLSQTPLHYLGVHERGRFMEVQKRQVSSSELQGVKRRIDPVIKQLKSALEDIKRMVTQHGERARLSLVCRNGRLEVFERQSGDSCLPAEYLEKYVGSDS
ncbi:geranylgeranyl pyrophosphate synthetase [Moniliophthora roreri MCA 2997]|uniref:Geranylgeranyl pyrophosphate synthetase n=1 Tax=Moniliophthora roreri (strain MCA 2997) TaxID=1381753 RepID=V2WQL9_MONRO|nr:geranylgeranyl pyrophosphate synthetase [Moniliophthora roreri MCA 2997]